MKWGHHKEETKRLEFKTKVIRRITNKIEDVNDWWMMNAEVVRCTAQKVLGQTSDKQQQKKAGLVVE